MKKLISILLMLMLLGCVALAETAGDENLVSGSDETVENVQEQEPAAEEPAEEPAQQDDEDNTQDDGEAASTSSWKDKRLSTKGLIVTAGGLAGTFLVLILFFLAIKLMGKMLK